MRIGLRLFFIGLMLALGSMVIGQQSDVIRGVVKDKDGKGVANVIVHLLNSNRWVVTDANGSFSFSGIAAGEYTLELTRIGYAAQTHILAAGQAGDVSIVLNDQSVQLDGVVVTAQKREEVLNRTPGSITALNGKEVQAYRLWNTKELTAIVPNFYANNSGDERNVVSIRGITTTSYDPAVAVYVDGVNQFSLDTYIPQLADIDRIEVLRGPQGTLYGRNAMGGVINIITKQPGNTTNGFAEVSVGNYNMQRYAAGIRTPLVKDKLFFGASAVYQTRDGYYTNDFNGRSFDDQSALTGNYYLRFLPSDRWAFTLNVKHQNNRNNGAFPMVFGTEEAFGNPYKLNQNAIGKMVDNTLNASLDIRYDGKGFLFNSQTAYQSNHRYYESPIDGDFSPLDAVEVINDFGSDWNKVKVFTQEFRFSSPTGKSSRMKWVAGSYFFHQQNPVKQATHFGEDAEMLGAPMTNFSTINTSTGKNTGVSLFGQLEYALTARLSLTGGMRYDYESRKLQVLGEFQPDGGDAFVTQPDTAATANFSALSPKLGLAFKLNDHSNLFLNYSRGFRTGGLTQLSSDPSQPPLYPYDPEYSNNIELGWKNLFRNERVRLNLTAFYTTVNNAQVPTLVLPDAITVTRNTGELESKGFEAELAAKPIRNLDVQYSFGYTDASYRSLKVSQGGDEVDLGGKKQLFTPDVTSMLMTQYSLPLVKEKQVSLVGRVEWFYLGQQYFDLGNSIRQDPYQLLNARLGVSSRKIDCFFWVRNLTGREYIAYAYDFGAVHLGNPKTIGVTATTRF
ncbi:TonB-dependent receptor [Flavihumibacter rivuli]|uniref:TonB-dependent receptor n=1 Tax=Flavihumibacter rivuli TaxID=2838156 RepID=UPI001BDDDC5E|nr:TonB-dependent receptor [Flavihumibacter rivuli]ULQ55326.1 TonB-dependent receptor [Flavihumibacter rivuli]